MDFRIANTFTDSLARSSNDEQKPVKTTGREERKGAISVFNGPAPVIRVLGTPEEETLTVRQWL